MFVLGHVNMSIFVISERVGAHVDMSALLLTLLVSVLTVTSMFDTAQYGFLDVRHRYVRRDYCSQAAQPDRIATPTTFSL